MSVHVSSRVWRCANARGTELICLLALADMADPDGVCWPSVATLAGPDYMRLKSERHAYRVLEALESKGEIQIAHLGGGEGSNRYCVLSGLSDAEVSETLIRRFSEFGFTAFDLEGVFTRRRKGADMYARGDTEVSPPLVEESYDPLLIPTTTHGSAKKKPGAAQATMFENGNGKPAREKALKPESILIKAFTSTVTSQACMPSGMKDSVKTGLALLRIQATEQEVVDATMELCRTAKRPANGRVWIWMDKLLPMVEARRADGSSAASQQHGSGNGSEKTPARYVGDVDTTDIDFEM